MRFNPKASIDQSQIQKRSGGRVDTDSFTHGPAEQRIRWFNKGMTDGTIKGL